MNKEIPLRLGNREPRPQSNAPLEQETGRACSHASSLWIGRGNHHYLEDIVLLEQPLNVFLCEVFPQVIRDSSDAPEHLAAPIEQESRKGHRVVVPAFGRRAP